MNKEKLIIIGASGHGKVVAEIAMKMNKWKTILFLDDDKTIKSSLGIDVIGTTKDAFSYIDEYDIFVAIGSNTIRERVFLKLENKGANFPVLIDPTAIISDRVKIEKGSVVMSGAIINCCTKIGKGAILNTGCTVDHDNVIEDFVHISPGVHTAGTVEIGRRTWLGIGSIVNNNLNITGNCNIGSGAVVVKDIKEPGTYVGIPARKLINNEK